MCIYKLKAIVLRNFREKTDSNKEQVARWIWRENRKEREREREMVYLIIQVARSSIFSRASPHDPKQKHQLVNVNPLGRKGLKDSSSSISLSLTLSNLKKKEK